MWRTALAAIVMFAVISCKKEEIKGPQGDPGINGKGGNASIDNTDEFFVGTGIWQQLDSVWHYEYATAAITSTVMATGGVKVFMKSATNVWQELPFAVGDILTQYSFRFGKIDIYVSDIHGGLPARPASSTFKAVTIYASQRPQNNAEVTTPVIFKTDTP